MAITMRLGTYEKLDPLKAKPAEVLVVTSGDPDTESGTSVYVCFKAGDVKRLASYEDTIQYLEDATAEELAALEAAINTAVTQANMISSTLETKLANGDFRGDTGPQGPQGEKGDPGETGAQGPKGDRGAQGESGVATLTSGMFYLSVSDSVLYCEYLDTDTGPQFEFTDGILYYTI